MRLITPILTSIVHSFPLLKEEKQLKLQLEEKVWLQNAKNIMQ